MFSLLVCQIAIGFLVDWLSQQQEYKHIQSASDLWLVCARSELKVSKELKAKALEFAAETFSAKEGNKLLLFAA